MCAYTYNQHDAGFASVEAILEKFVPHAERTEVLRVLHGWNAGAPVQAIPLPDAVATAAAAGDFDLQAYRFQAAPEQLRAPRLVKVSAAATRAAQAGAGAVAGTCGCTARCMAPDA